MLQRGLFFFQSPFCGEYCHIDPSPPVVFGLRWTLVENGFILSTRWRLNSMTKGIPGIPGVIKRLPSFGTPFFLLSTTLCIVNLLF